jgi:hypothetical protein
MNQELTTSEFFNGKNESRHAAVVAYANARDGIKVA